MPAADDLQARLAAVGYVADENLATALRLAIDLGRPLLLEGEAGVGKTEVAKALAALTESRLIRLQCYEGLDASAAIYEWNYQRQLLSIKASERFADSAAAIEARIFSEEFLLARPLLQAIRQETPPVLLIDEIDRADEEFEALLLEVLSEFQITVPELGTISATAIPRVILTSNRTRELSDALRRRCLYAFVDFPTADRELAIIRARLPHIEETLARQIAEFVHLLRDRRLEKMPGIAETLDWSAALADFDIMDLRDDPARVQPTLMCLLKTESDLKSLTPDTTRRLLEEMT